jgi:hypothetical protein
MTTDKMFASTRASPRFELDEKQKAVRIGEPPF